QLAAVYRVDEVEVRSIVGQAAADVRVRVATQNATPVIDSSTLRHAAREKTHRDVGKFARLVSSNYTWADLVLPDDIKVILQDFCNSARRRARVYDDWGYAKKHARGPGLVALFSGESGTGKTRSAEVIAADVGVNMYKVDLSAVISKWVGETERHLGQIFDSTENSDSILFFDEADAIFGKRTEVSDSKDRYANIEVSYLLQRVEEYSGIVILSSNLRSAIDEAFLRRMQFGIQFPMPDLDGRREIWRRAFPGEVPLDKGVDFDFLAKEYDELSGGQIKIVAMGAAMLAAGTDTTVTLKHLQRAFENEMIKMQRVLKNDVPGMRRSAAGVVTRGTVRSRLLD